ncbi:MAG TPA: cytochrome c maturation protein CcmE [Acidimicrobiia bacterium]|nr:cytochrome c maturation protein CcmE [Acidimicrobiia bacterium]
MTHRRFVLIGAIGVVALVGAVAATSLSSGLTYYLYPTEAVDQRVDFPDGARFRLAGMVVEGSVAEAGTVTSFSVTDGGATIPVDLDGRVPPLFSDGVPVLVEGAWEGDRFLADEAVIRHDENYSVPEEGGGFES